MNLSVEVYLILHISQSCNQGHIYGSQFNTIQYIINHSGVATIPSLGGGEGSEASAVAQAYTELGAEPQPLTQFL